MNKYYVTIIHNNGITGRGYILDISKSGVAVACAKRVCKNTVIELHPAKDIFLPIKGRVVSSVSRHRKTFGHRLGIKFISPGKKEKAKLSRFVAALEKRYAVRLPF
ncbi:MAG: PilZ domain-containing protein [Candidatus Omnitrophica bacterium]|nr:PilZ domain-containing protein [Candidatus Omnitrophota bacterium]